MKSRSRGADQTFCLTAGRISHYNKFGAVEHSTPSLFSICLLYPSLTKTKKTGGHEQSECRLCKEGKPLKVQIPPK